MAAFIFTDIEDSSRKWERYKELFAKALARHDAIMNAAIPQFGGKIVKHTGDGIFAEFDNDMALHCAMTLGVMFRKADWNRVGGLRIRVGVHAGEAERRDHDFFGAEVGVAARVMALAAGGQILFTPAAMQASKMPPRATMRELGAKALKGYTQPYVVLELVLPPPEERAADLPNPGLIADVDTGDFNALHALLNKYLESKAFVEGIMVFRKLAARDNRNGRVYLHLGALYEAGGYTEDAIRALQTAVQLLPDEEAGYQLLAGCCLLKRHFELAITTCREGLKRFPSAPRLHFNLGYAYAQRGRHEEAIAEFQAELDVDPSCSQAKFNMDAVAKRQVATLHLSA